jgi:hypothetical protein
MPPSSGTRADIMWTGGHNETNGAFCGMRTSLKSIHKLCATPVLKRHVTNGMTGWNIAHSWSKGYPCTITTLPVA